MLKSFDTIRIKLWSVLGLITAGWIIFGIISLTSHGKLSNYQQLNDQITQYKNGLEAIKDSFEGLSAVSVRQTGTEDEEKADNFTASLNEAISRLNHLTAQITENHFFYSSESNEVLLLMVDENLNDLQEDHTTIIELIQERNLEETGAVSQWNTEARLLSEIGSVSNNNFVQRNIAQLVRYKSAYLSTPDEAIIHAITVEGEQLKNDIQQDTLMFPSEKDQLAAAINDYMAAANSVLEKDIRIGLTHQSGLVGNALGNISDMQQQLDNISDNILSVYQTIKLRSQAVLWIFWILFVLVIIGLSLLTVHYFTNATGRIARFINQMSTGSTPEKIHLDTNDEFNSIASGLNKHMEHLQEKIAFATSMAEGITDVEFNPAGKEDDLGNALLSLSENLEKTKKEEEKNAIESQKRSWTNEGLAKFADILRQNNDNLDKLADNLIISLVKYIEATQGGIFLINDDNADNPILELKSSVAYDRRKFVQRTFEMGEGLVGTVAVEKKSILLTEIPQDYMEITSGLGEAEPNCLLIVPLKLENKILGVLELASFNVFQPHEVDFIETIGESIASTLTTVRVNERTAELLEKSQRQASEMAEQEEEMRQNMEELQATQEEASRRETEITSILNAVHSTSLVVEYDLDGNILNINEKFLKLMNLPKRDIIGIHHSDFTAKNRTENVYIEFWNTMLKGEAVNNTEVIKLPTGKKLWLNQSYTPILNQEGKPTKIINIAVDITATKTTEQELEKKSREVLHKTNEFNTLNTAINQSIIKSEFKPDGTIVDANDNFAAMLGYPLKDILNKNLWDFMNDEEKDVLDSFWANLVNKSTHKTNLKRIKPNGEIQWLISTFTPVIDDDANVYKIYYLAQDITEQKMKYELLVEANKEIDRLKHLLGEKGTDQQKS
ncbi:MAG: PAS domain-containing protein [Bacteroidota bacterium]